MAEAPSLPFIIHKNIFPELTVSDIQREVVLKRDTFMAVRNGVEVECLEPRLTEWFSNSGHDFVYSGKTMEAKPMPKILQDVRNRLFELTGTEYCSVLVNLYPDGRSGMRYHQDPLYSPTDQTVQIWADDAAVVSIGESRMFILREKEESEYRRYYRNVVENGDVVHMFETCQRDYQHTVKTQKNVTNPRISLVYKKHL